MKDLPKIGAIQQEICFNFIIFIYFYQVIQIVKIKTILIDFYLSN